MANKKKKRGLTPDVGQSRRRAESGQTATKKVKSDVEGLDAMAPLDFSTPKTVLETLLHPISFDTFFAEHWETKPLLVRRSAAPDDSRDSDDNTTGANYAKYFSRLFSKRALDDLVARHRLEFVRDVNCVRYADRQRCDLNDSGRVTAAKLSKIFGKQKGTLQVHQPQRFENELWRILENLESFFGCLVGSNVYITPPESQGLPPHHDDVEVFILQLEGKKSWKLYKPIVDLPQEYSGDLSEDNIGTPFMEFTLQAGDMVYFPRGTIHQAETSNAETCSTHITISTYQRHTWGDYLLSVFPSILDEAMAADVSFRRGLPLNFLRSSKISKSSKVHSVVDLLLQKLKYNKFLPPATMIEDFMQNRLPPYSINRKTLQENMPTGIPPDSASKVRLKFADHVCYLLVKDRCAEDSDEDEEDDEEDGSSEAGSCSPENGEHSSQQRQSSSKSSATTEEVLFVHSSLFNNRKLHMFNSSAADNDQTGFALKFPPHMEEAMDFLKCNSDHFIEASQLPLSSPDIECLLRGLWASHLLEVQPSKSGRRGVKALKVD